MISQISGWKYSQCLVSSGLDIARTDSPEIRTECGQLQITGAVSGTTVVVTDIAGRNVVSRYIGDDGKAVIDMGSLQKGIHVVSCAGYTCKLRGK